MHKSILGPRKEAEAEARMLAGKRVCARLKGAGCQLEQVFAVSMCRDGRARNKKRERKLKSLEKGERRTCSWDDLPALTELSN